MSRVEVPEEIEHLDFEPGKEEDLIHHRHPTVASLSWCGTASSNHSFMSTSGNGTSLGYTCPRCLGLIRAFGANWYWATHRKHFNSNCTARNGVIYHDCGA